MEIAPRADPLIVEAKVAPPDIDQVAMRAPVRVRINAGNRRTTPDLDGTVTFVSPDLTSEPLATPLGMQKQQYYVVRVSLSDTAAKAVGDLQMVPGMPVEVYIHTQDRTPLDYLMKPLHEQLARAFRER
jgi:HlyD family secretion protein